MGSGGFDSKSMHVLDRCSINARGGNRRSQRLESFETTRGMRRNFAREQRWSLRAMRALGWGVKSVRFLWYRERVLPPTAAPPGPNHPLCPLPMPTKVSWAGPHQHIGAPAGQPQLGCAQIRRHFPGFWKGNGSNDRFTSPDW